jgi:hypothetical protein
MNPALGDVVVALFGSGVALAVFSAGATFVWRRPGLTFGELFWAGSSAAAHPERYVRSDRLTAIRVLNIAGVSLIVASVLISLVRGIWPLL